jgi:hypothetical protein
MPTPPRVSWLKYSLCVACKETDLFKYLLLCMHSPRGLYFDTSHVCVQWSEGSTIVRLNGQDRQATRLYGAMCLGGEMAITPWTATAVVNLFGGYYDFCWYFIRSLKQTGVLHWKFIAVFVFPNVRGSVLMEFVPLRLQQIHGNLYFSSRQHIR